MKPLTLTSISWSCRPHTIKVGARTLIFEHVGHLPMLEAPQETAAQHLALLARPRAPQG